MNYLELSKPICPLTDSACASKAQRLRFPVQFRTGVLPMSKYRWACVLMAAALLKAPTFAEDATPPKAPEPPKETPATKETPAPNETPKGDPVRTPVTNETPKKPQSLEEAAAKIPAVELEDGILIQSGDLKVPMTTVEPRKRARFVAHTKRDPKWEAGCGRKSEYPQAGRRKSDDEQNHRSLRR